MEKLSNFKEASENVGHASQTWPFFYYLVKIPGTGYFENGRKGSAFEIPSFWVF